MKVKLVCWTCGTSIEMELETAILEKYCKTVGCNGIYTINPTSYASNGRDIGEDEIIKLCRDAGFTEKQWKAMTFDRQPYDVTIPTVELTEFVRLLKLKFIEKL
jgi:hypothetical protein